MRKNRMMRILQIVLIITPVVGISDEMPRELTNELAMGFERSICGDTTFLKCAGVKEKECSDAVNLAVRSCDYSPVWREIQRLESNQTATDQLSSEGEIFGSCVNKELQKTLDISSLLFERCMTELQEGWYEKALQKKLGNQ